MLLLLERQLVFNSPQPRKPGKLKLKKVLTALSEILKLLLTRFKKELQSTKKLKWITKN